MPLTFWIRWSLRDLTFLLISLALIAFLGLCARLLPDLPTPAVAILWALLALGLTMPLVWKARRKRRGLLQAYIRPESWLYRWLRGGVVMLAVRLILALGLSAALLLGVARLGSAGLFWGAVVALPLWVKVHAWVHWRLERHVQPPLLGYAAAQWVFWSVGVAVLTAVAVLGLYQPVPDLRDLALMPALEGAARQVSVHSGLLGNALALLAVFEVALYWLAQNPAQDTFWPLRLIIWTLLMMRDWLFIWPVLLLMQLGYVRGYRHDRD